MLNWRTSVLGQPSTCPKTGLQNEPKRLGKWAKFGTTNWTPYTVTQDRIVETTVDFEVHSSKELKQAIENIRRIKNVDEVARIDIE